MSGSRISLAALAACVALGACNFDRAIVTSPIGDPAYNFALRGDGRGIPGGRVERVVPDADTDYPTVDSTYQIVVTSVEPLTSGVYQVWLGNVTAADDGWVPAVGTIEVTRIDTTFTAEGDPIPDTVVVSTTNGASSFTEGGPATQIRITVSRASLGGQSPFAFGAMVISLEDAAGSAQPTLDMRPIWNIVTGGTGSSRTVIVGTDTATASVTTTSSVFGNFDPTPADRYVFVATGRGTGGIRGGVMIVDDSALARPPAGYYYATWTVKRDENGNAIDTLALGEQTAPFPDRDVSLRDADVDASIHPVVLVSPPSILAAANRIVMSGGASAFLGFEDVWVTLENKLGDEDEAAPTKVLSGTVPEIISAP